MFIVPILPYQDFGALISDTGWMTRIQLVWHFGDEI